MALMIETRGLTKVYRTGVLRKAVPALDGLTLDVRPGEIFGFLGPNGAGKTTTIKILLGFVRPTSGVARVLGGRPDDPAVRRRLGFMPEQPYFYAYLTGEEFLDYAGQLHGLPRPVRRARAAALLEATGIAHAARLPLRKYSKGMLQRLGLAQALINDPELVILDEPMSGLDPIGRREVRDLILRLRREGRTVFFSTHILSDAETLADRVAILAQGRVVGLGTLDELLADRPERIELCAADLASATADTLARLASSHVVRNGHHLFVLDSRSRADDALRALAAGGGRLVSFVSQRGSLEELFVERVGTPAEGGTSR
ncbi:MAG TPA: ABC transporter ATP-binding protein [Thermodesulfobacteriota bacterium]|nr:ABC transporter ATP-binding protein [Thermodesulfobacteriota bacterium]